MDIVFRNKHCSHATIFINLFYFYSPKQQAKMAAHCRNILGDAILGDALESHPVSNVFMTTNKQKICCTNQS